MDPKTWHDALKSVGKEKLLADSKPKFLTKEERARLSQSQKGLQEERDRPSASPVSVVKKNASPSLFLSQQERKLVKERYLGVPDKQVKKLRRFGDRRALFDWDEKDDTSRDEQVLLPSLPPFSSTASKPNTKPATNSQLKDAPRPSTVKAVDMYGNEVEVTAFSDKRSRFDDRHWSEKQLENMVDRDWRIFKEDFSIATAGGVLPNPLRYWEEARFPNRLASAIHDIGYTEPTPIQRQAIPVILSGRDLIGIAETGSGKTAAFILPMICQILQLPPMNQENMLDGPYGLVLAPTRELAMQIEQETKKFCQHLGLRCLAIVGGHSLAEQSVHMRNGVEIVIATPGRLRDCLEQHVLALNQCYSIVLDEADRMIDMNFEEDLHYILGCLPSDTEKPDSEAAENPMQFLKKSRFRQTTMFSATMPSSVEKLARLYLRRPATVTVGQAGQAAETVEQCVKMMKEEGKDKQLIEILESGEFDPPIIVFVNQKKTVDFLARRLEALGFRCTALHGGKNQEQREVAIGQLRKSGRDILIATDVAGRGIDIKDVSLVINYDMPKSIEDYIHRIGRTGRMGKSGVAITFLTPEDSDMYFDLRVILQKAPKASIPHEFLAHEASRVRPGTIVQKKRHEERIYAYGV